MAGLEDHPLRPDHNQKGFGTRTSQLGISRDRQEESLGRAATNVQEIQATQETDGQVEGAAAKAEVLGEPKHDGQVQRKRPLGNLGLERRKTINIEYQR